MVDIGADVSHIKAILSEELAKRVGDEQKLAELGFDSGDVTAFRWHGVKATLTTMMQHWQGLLSLDERAIRLAGDWKAKGGSMLDTYLRQAQLLVLSAQEKVLRHIRGGARLGGLESAQISQGVPLSFTSGDLEEGQIEESKSSHSAYWLWFQLFRSGSPSPHQRHFSRSLHQIRHAERQPRRASGLRRDRCRRAGRRSRGCRY